MIRRYKIEGSKIAEVSLKEDILVLINPDDNEKQYVLGNFGMDAHNLNSSLDPEEPARVEFENDHVSVIFKRPKNYSSKDHFLFKVSSMGLFLFKEKLIIVLSEDVNIFSGKQYNNVSGIRDVFLKVIYNSIYHFVEHLKVINMIAEEIETKINKSMENKYLLHMFTLEKSLVYYVSAITANSFVLERLKIHVSKVGFDERLIEFLEDIAIENGQAKSQADVYSQVFAGLMDARASVINNNMNIWLKNLTIITIAIAVPNFFASMGGMSELERVIGVDNVRLAQGIFLVFSLILAVSIIEIFRKIEKNR